jgi:hypothetical protein
MVVAGTFERYLFLGANFGVPFLFGFAGLLSLSCVRFSEADSACSERYIQEGLYTQKKTGDRKADLYLQQTLLWACCPRRCLLSLSSQHLDFFPHRLDEE